MMSEIQNSDLLWTSWLTVIVLYFSIIDKNILDYLMNSEAREFQ